MRGSREARLTSLFTSGATDQVQTNFPQRPTGLNQSRLIMTCPEPPTHPILCNLCVYFSLSNRLGRMRVGGGGAVDNTDRSRSQRLFIFPSTQFLPPQISPTSCLQPTGSTAALEPPTRIHRAWLSHSLLIIFYKSNATQFFPHYREPWGGCPAIGRGDVTWAGSRGPERKKGVLFGVNLDSNSVIYQGIS